MIQRKYSPGLSIRLLIRISISNQKGMENFELLVRSLLDRPDQPAVVILGHFSPQIHNTYGFAGPDHWHNVVAQFYDVPHVRYVPLSRLWKGCNHLAVA